ncbi:hypothetical protein TNCV_3921611 [Trichonephila clavipes]|nr:hypothetical protein TNCV_3921611 [Trichonephila clavipes]
MRKRFVVTPEEDIQRIEVQGTGGQATGHRVEMKRKLDESDANGNDLYPVTRRRVKKSNIYQRSSPHIWAVEKKAAG